MTIYIPSVGEQGAFTASAPFSLASGKQYQCVSVRRFDELAQSHVDVYAIIYQPLGLALSVYQADAIECPVLIGLSNSAGDISYVPAKYLQQSPIVSGVPYQEVILTMDIGPLPTSQSLAGAQEAISSVVTEVLGIDAIVSVVRLPQTDHYTQIQHEALLAARAAKQKMDYSDRGRYIALQEENRILRLKVDAMAAILQGKATFLLDGVETSVAQALVEVQ